ncbi:serrate RNA effector molecule homolog [Ostrinia furnacalis]|uniref:serrate RNA effector molecule homolog n=1 Tax=Ostrinia furnacalis TaxID=93504 RepID=UPI001039F9A0|nr:serrate RNA effector molecule homolog [Ostrinia furnacalis]
MKKLSQKKPQLLIDLKDPFMDFTRAVGLNQKSERSDLKDRFSTDYIDIGDLRMKKKNRNLKAKRRNTNIIYRASDSSDTDSDESIEIQKQSYYKKPKRFQVIENILSKEKESDDDSDDSSVEYKKPYKKPNAKTYKKPYVMPHKNQYKEPKRPNVEPHKNPEDSDDSSDDEYEKPYKTPRKKPINTNPYKKPANKKPVKKEYYLQGTRLVSPSSEEDARRRIQHFLPKRFHWEPEDIQNLGYYWFNGPQGRYPYFAIRP